MRFYAVEALYNITKVVRGGVLIYFNEIFDGLCKLYADVDIDVKNGAQLLDRLIKDVVTETEGFDVKKFIPLLKERIKIRNPFIRQLIVGWITVLDSVPDIDMLEFLPDFLGGLFDMLSDPNKDIRQQASSTLDELLREVLQQVNAVELESIIRILIQQCDNRDTFTRLTVLVWMNELINVGRVQLMSLVPDVLECVLNCLADPEKEIRQKSEETQNLLLKLIADAHNASLLNHTIIPVTSQLSIEKVLNCVVLQLSNKWVPSRLASLRWIDMLLTNFPVELYSHLLELSHTLLKILQDNDDQVVRLALQVIARICVNKNAELDATIFTHVLEQLVHHFYTERRLLESRGALIIRQLCELLEPESIYRVLANILIHEEPEFASLMIQTLNLILLTSSELSELRNRLKKSLLSSEGKELFMILYQSWTHNSISTFALCLLAQAYELASALIEQLAEMEMTVGCLMQIDKLVQLIESPIFIHLRLQLLEPKTHPYLYKSMYGILMLLPQSHAFTALKIRLESVTPLGLLDVVPDQQQQNNTASVEKDSQSVTVRKQTNNDATALVTASTTVASSTSATTTTAVAVAASSSTSSLTSSSPFPNRELLEHFKLMQQKHALKRQKAQRDGSLLKKNAKPFTATQQLSSNTHDQIQNNQNKGAVTNGATPQLSVLSVAANNKQ